MKAKEDRALIWKWLKSRAQKQRPRVPDHSRIYAIGDVHGRADLLQEVFTAIDESLASHPVQNPVQVMLGDYIDRGADSRAVIETLLERRRRRQMVYLRGNHETFPADFLADPSNLSHWQQMGGLQTLLSYGVKPSMRHEPGQEQRIAAAFRQALPKSHYDFLNNLALSFSCGDYFFVHAGVRPGIPLSQQREDDLLWIRDDFLLHEGSFGKIIVHGHTPAEKPDIRANRINIDTGAFATGRLTCLVLQGDQMALM